MENNKSKGLGDSIEKITKTTGIKSLAQVLARNGILGKKKDCGCNKRNYGKYRYSISKSFSFS